jgi:hypothetical protein
MAENDTEAARIQATPASRCGGGSGSRARFGIGGARLYYEAPPASSIRRLAPPLEAGLPPHCARQGGHVVVAEPVVCERFLFAGRPRASPVLERSGSSSRLGPAEMEPDRKQAAALPAEPPDVLGSFGAWAAVSARLLKRPRAHKERILDELGIRHVWPDASERWSAALAGDVAAERLDRLEQYRRLCAEEMKRRGAPRPAPAMPATTQPLDLREARAALGGGAGARSPYPEADFRSRLMSPRPAPPAEEAAAPAVPAPAGPVRAAIELVGPPESFRAALAPADIQPRAPQPGQKATGDMPMAETVNVLRAAKAALDWPVERYARLCAELEADPGKRELTAARHGLRGEMVVDFVQRGWQKRFAADPALAARCKEMVAAYQQLLAGRGQGG